ncbi:MAG: sortase [Candidatus Paceibacterota bacterium]|jgi:LPXTG-site transpeptidase (sortase) family protein
MKRLITITARLIQSSQRAYTKKWSFFGVFVLVFLGSVSALARLDLLPASSSAEARENTQVSANIAEPAIPELPIKVSIPAINLSATIANPTAADAATLDKELLRGAVRYPTSARLGEEGNVVLFGHSSYLPIVGNQSYKTFNGIQKLKTGDIITVSSLSIEYTYRVKSVTKESANGNSAIPLSVAGKTLTLVTCNSFAKKTDRFVVVADFVESHPLPAS